MKKQQKKIFKNATDSKIQLQAISNLSNISEFDTFYIEDWKNNRNNHVSLYDDVQQKPIIHQNFPKVQQQREKKVPRFMKKQHNIKTLQKQLIFNRYKNKGMVSVPRMQPIYRYDKEDSSESINLQKNVNKEDSKEAKNEKIENSRSLEKQKLRKMSLPWIKQIPYAKMSLKEQAQKKHYQKNLQVIRRKKSYRYLKNKKEEDVPTQERKTRLRIVKKSVDEKKEEDDLRNSYNHELELLKKWLQINKKKNRKSITSLLRQHFESRYQQKKQHKHIIKSINEKYKTLLN